MKTVLLVASVLMAAGPVAAQTLPSTPAMQCRNAQALVSQRGAVVLSTGGRTYDRYVANENDCPLGLVPDDGYVPTKDNPQCFVGYYCSDDIPPYQMR